jgi:hypothetical protein
VLPHDRKKAAARDDQRHALEVRRLEATIESNRLSTRSNQLTRRALWASFFTVVVAATALWLTWYINRFENRPWLAVTYDANLNKLSQIPPFVTIQVTQTLHDYGRTAAVDIRLGALLTTEPGDNDAVKKQLDAICDEVERAIQRDGVVIRDLRLQTPADVLPTEHATMKTRSLGHRLLCKPRWTGT